MSTTVPKISLKFLDSFKKDLIERRLFPAFGETNDIFSSRRKSKKDKTFIENGKKSNLEEMRLKANFRKNGAREFRVSGGGGKAEDQLIFRKHLETLRANLRETEVDEGKHTIFGVASSDNIDMKGERLFAICRRILALFFVILLFSSRTVYLMFFFTSTDFMF